MSSRSQVQRVPREELDRKGQDTPLWATLGYCLAAGLSLWNIKERTVEVPAPPRPRSGVKMKETE